MTDERAGGTTVLSADGTRIAVERTGVGTPLVVIHGSLGTASDWQGVAAALADHVAVDAIDRRGRGASGEGEPHSMEREFEDLAAVRAIAGSDAVVLGHSYGAVVALGQALLDPPRALVVYEPPLPLDGPIGGEALPRYERAVAEGRLDDALTIGLVHFVGVPAEVVPQLRAVLPWDRLASLTPTWVREMHAIDAFDADLGRFAALDIPVLALVGEMSTPGLVSTSERLVAALPNAELVRMPGQAHDAHVTAPAMIAGLVDAFLDRLPPR